MQWTLLQASHSGPYLSLVVVTRHDTAPSLFNTRFRLNFGTGRDEHTPVDSLEQLQRQLQQLHYPTELTLGRSSGCNMALDYRTVSTIHAKISFVSEGNTGPGSFFLQVAARVFCNLIISYLYFCGQLFYFSTILMSNY